MTTDAVSLQLRLFPVAQQIHSSDDYYTPKHVFDRLGLRFDLDVASPPGGSPWVPANKYYTQAEDGLSADWHGRVWMNPPYSRCTPWVKRFIEHRDGIALLPFAKSKWFTEIWNKADCLVVDSSGFWNFVGGSISIPVFFAGFGPDCVEALQRIGLRRFRR